MVAFPLSSIAREAGYRVIGFDSIGSTNAEAIAAAQAGEADKLWFAALQQTSGRGRRGRAWESPHGNLAASLLIQPDVSPAALATLGFVAGVALNDALSRLLPNVSVRSGVDGADGIAGQSPARIALKWPNDVLADGAKLAGILLEAIPLRNGRTAVVIGIGVNVVAAPEGLPYPAVALSSFNPIIDAAMVFEALAESWVQWYDTWNYGHGTSRIIERWRGNAAGIGSEVAVQRSQGVLRGIFESIDDAGHLIVRDNEGHRIAITAGDVHFGTTATLR